MKAQDVMTAPVVTVAPEAPVPEIAALLIERQISAVPVVDGGAVVGIVSEGDLLRRGETRTERRRPGWSRCCSTGTSRRPDSSRSTAHAPGT